MSVLRLPDPRKLLLPDLVVLLFYAGVFTVSFDIFLVMSAGFNFRFAQVAWGLPIAVAFLLTILNRRVKVPLGIGALWLWFVAICVFIPNTTLPARSIGYAFWLAFSIALILATCVLFDHPRRFLGLLRCYMHSFLVMAGFGLIQFITPLLKLPPLFVEQWWFEGRVARINGFSYEPSYYASYMLMGWVLSAYLLQSKSEVFEARYLKLVFYATTVALILSSSRMGWVMMILWYVQYPLRFLGRLMKGRFNSTLLKQSLLLLAVAGAGVGAVIFVIGSDRVMFLLNGVGLFGAASHSTGTRTRQMIDTFRLFLESPWIGYSLGGISAGLGQLRGITVDSIALAKQNEGMAIFAEVLAASGVIGVMPFIWYMVTLIVLPFRRAAQVFDPNVAGLLKGLVIAFCFELAILQFNQNILRPYVWLHIAILSAAFSVSYGFIRGKQAVPPEYGTDPQTSGGMG